MEDRKWKAWVAENLKLFVVAVYLCIRLFVNYINIESLI